MICISKIRKKNCKLQNYAYLHIHDIRFQIHKAYMQNNIYKYLANCTQQP